MSSEDVVMPATEPVSVFQSDLPIDAKLERARTELLDLSARNRLLNIPRSAKSAKTLEIIDERGVEVFRLLSKDGKAFTFLAGRGEVEEGEDEIAELVQPDEDGVDTRGVSNRHSDTRLQTRLTPAGLQKKLLDIYYDARTLEEEQGVNILFLAIGTLKWIDPNNATVSRFAPLILVPVELERGNAAEKFKLKSRQEDFAANLSLEAYLDRVHGVKLPTFEAGDDFDPRVARWLRLVPGAGPLVYSDGAQNDGPRSRPSTEAKYRRCVDFSRLYNALGATNCVQQSGGDGLALPGAVECFNV